MKVKFKRERKGGVQTAKVRINGAALVFKRDEAVFELEAGGDHEICWFLIGPSGAALKVVMTAAGANQTLVEAAIKPEHGSQLSDCRLFRIEEVTS